MCSSKKSKRKKKRQIEAETDGSGSQHMWPSVFISRRGVGHPDSLWHNWKCVTVIGCITIPDNNSPFLPSLLLCLSIRPSPSPSVSLSPCTFVPLSLSLSPSPLSIYLSYILYLAPRWQGPPPPTLNRRSPLPSWGWGEHRGQGMTTSLSSFDLSSTTHQKGPLVIYYYRRSYSVVMAGGTGNSADRGTL